MTDKINDLIMQLKTTATGQYDVAENIMHHILTEFDAKIAVNTVTYDDLETTQDALEYYITNFNPWAVYAKNYRCGTQNPKFILNNKDQEIIDRHNNKNTTPEFEIKTNNLLPTPFVGNLKTAKFVLLLKNPGFDNEDTKRISQDKWTSTVLDNLENPLSYAGGMLFLRPDYQTFINNTKDCGDKWWNDNINIKDAENGLTQLFAPNKIYEHIADIELFPYASEKFGVSSKSVTEMSSWFFTKCLIRYVMGRGVPIFIRSGMLNSIPDFLQEYRLGGRHPYAGRLFATCGQKACVSDGNIKQVGALKELLVQIQSVK